MINQIIPAPGYFAVYDDNGSISRVELQAFCLVTFDKFSEGRGVLGIDETCIGGFCEDEPNFLGYETPNGGVYNWSQLIQDRRRPLDDRI